MSRVLTALTIGHSSGLLVDEMCRCGGQESRRVWRVPGDLRNQHRSDCPAVAVLSRLPWIEDELRAATTPEPGARETP